MVIDGILDMGIFDADYCNDINTEFAKKVIGRNSLKNPSGKKRSNFKLRPWGRNGSTRLNKIARLLYPIFHHFEKCKRQKLCEV